MRNISAWAIRHPVTPIVLFVVLFFMGVVAFIRLPINLNPDVSFPAVNVDISEPGAAPTEMETQIAQKVEGSISSIGAVRHIVTFITEAPSRMCVTPLPRFAATCRREFWSRRCRAKTWMAVHLFTTHSVPPA
jgi:multidrug efflux pump subunit AcrB